MRILFVILAVLLLVPAWSGAERLPLHRGPPAIDVKRVALYPDDPARRDVGGLRYLGGAVLTSRDPAFGGFSALHVRGDRFSLLSDGGTVVQFRMGDDWTPHDIRLHDLGGPGTGWEKRDRDTESLAVRPDGSVLVGYERHNQIWRFSPDMSRIFGHVAPRPMAAWSANSGAEAMAQLRDGSVVVLSESHAEKGQRGYSAVRFLGDPTRPGTRYHRFYYTPPVALVSTDATELPDGRLLVLTRRARLRDLFTSTLEVVDIRSVRPGQTLRGKTLAVLAPPTIHDNFEALAMTREAGRTILWMMSDDNQSRLQRTYLLKFAL
ncbi:esterase-like activity of phytase family protein [Sphingomonas sp. CFBP 13720]|uniref:esterase-like activity of phytase family protein n=1 Tax=Sphingomonas sp. CFBP 13720 TaxID=2775302 RepID=UPI00177EA4B8|nr:esterase-like activity of phytase family protein [Sphingomonas sp. CFBP 13720]MBD8679984.1 esterase-like activity of phytase family protein [Sphingomonas sp. CFBP 13720]